MRAHFLPLLIAALAVLSPIAAQDPNAPADTGADPNAGGDGGDTGGDTGGDPAATSGADGGASAAPSPTDGGAQQPTTSDGSAAGGSSDGNAAIMPTEPSGDTAVKVGTPIHITWDINADVAPWNNVTIEFMTGPNFNQISLATIVSGFDAMNQTSYDWNAPVVHPYSKIYFLRFANWANGQMSPQTWSTRFAITGPNGENVPPTEADKDVNGNIAKDESGNPIYFGIGALGPDNNSTATPTAPAAQGTGPNGITLYMQGLNTGTDIPPGVTLTGVAAATIGAAGPGNGPNGPVGGGATHRVSAAAPAAVVGAVVAAAALFA